MRILLWSTHRYTPHVGRGTGLHPRHFASGSGHYLHDLLAKGLAELGHDVFYYLDEGAEKAPSGITIVSNPIPDIDILHSYSVDRCNVALMRHATTRQIPWVGTCHLDIDAWGMPRSHAEDNWIFVSHTLARLYGRRRYVLNGIDPAAFIYSETKGSYVLFMANMDWAYAKGLDIALTLARDVGFELVVAGTGMTYDTIEQTAALCRKAGARYVGDVRGEAKAGLLAGARAVLQPSRVQEAFGLVMAEALMSGTPVICSDRGACPEIISPDVGFVCSTMQDYHHAIEHLATISSRACRERAMQNYHYLRMAAGYVQEYDTEIAQYAPKIAV